MNMIEAVKSVLSQFVEFGGRARRSEYWYWTLATILVAIAISILEYVLGIGSDASGPLSSIFSLLIFLPGLAVSFRRLHDTGRSGWWIGGFYLGMLVLGIIIGVMAVSLATTTSAESSMAAFGIGLIGLALVIVIYAIALLVFHCQDSQPGPNKYGPNPKDVGNFDVFE